MDFLNESLGLGGRFNEWVLAFRGMPTGLWAWVLAAAVLAMAVMAWTSLGRVSSRFHRASLFTLRMAALGLAVLVLLQPALELRKVIFHKTHLAVLLDDSRSMSLPAKNETSRAQQAAAWFSSHVSEFDKLAQRYVVDVYRFSESLTASSLAQAGSAAGAAGRDTGLYRALGEVAGRYATEDLSGLVVVSDGCDTLGRPEAGDPRQDCPATGCDTPLFSFAPGFDDSRVDLAITAVRYDDFAFVHNTVSIDVELVVRGEDDLPVTVALNREDRPLTSHQVTLKKGEPATVSLSFKPDKVGRALYEVRLPVLPDETVTDNNRRQFILNIIRDKVRVLQVVGRPDWDERFLRQFLKKNPNVDLISFFILRNQEDNLWVPEEELSLIQFPTDELFNTELHTFDLVIFQNFTYKGYQMAYYLRNIAQFVREGGAFAMVGGDLSFAAGGYAHTEIEDILPVTLMPGPGKGFDPAPFNFSLTSEGMRHPLMQLDRDPEKNAALWQELPQSLGCNTGLSLRADAVALAVRPGRTSQGGSAPLVAIRRVDKGRSMAVAVDSTWRWNFHVVRQGGTPEYYNRFWSNAIRWLIKDPDWRHVQMLPAKDTYAPGETATVSIRVLNENFLPAEGALVRVTATDAAGVVTTKEVTADSEGLATLNLLVSQATGPTVLTAEARIGPDLAERTEALLLVDEGGREMADVTVCRGPLTELSSKSGGQAFLLTDAVKVDSLPFADVRARRIADREDVPLWDNWYVVGLLAALLSVEWFWRRRLRLP